MNLINKAQNGHLHALISKIGITKEEKKIMIHSATEGRSESSKDLTEWEAKCLIKALEVNNPSTKIKPGDKQRKKIIMYFRNCGHSKDGKADMSYINEWCKRYGYLHKKLNDYTVKQLPKLVYQAEQMYNDFCSATK